MLHSPETEGMYLRELIAIVLDRNITVTEFELPLHNYVLFRTNVQGNFIVSINLQAMS